MRLKSSALQVVSRRRAVCFHFRSICSRLLFPLMNILRLIYYIDSSSNVHEKNLNFTHDSDTFQKMVKPCFLASFLCGLPAQFFLCFLAFFVPLLFVPLRAKKHIPPGLAFRSRCAYRGFHCCRGVCVPRLGGSRETSLRFILHCMHSTVRMCPAAPAHSVQSAALTPAPCEPWPPAQSPPAGWGGSGS